MGPISPPTVVSDPPRDFGANAAPNVYFRDPDVIVIEPEFGGLIVGNASIEWLWTGAMWARPGTLRANTSSSATSPTTGRCTISARTATSRSSASRPTTATAIPSTSRAGRFSFEHLMRRVVRYELDGSVTVLADSFEGNGLNSPNDGAVHPDGSIWFTDPPWGGSFYEGSVDAAGGLGNPNGVFNPRLGQSPDAGPFKRELPTQTYRLAPDGTLTVVITEEQAKWPNGLAFSPD